MATKTTKEMIRNPILPGYYPDPSICRVGKDFYLVCSSFEMVPGLPIFHSRDLVHWEQIGNAMTQDNGFYMERSSGVGGLMAPTLRYHNGTFYILNANFADQGNFIITAKDPKGTWSCPHWLRDVPGIDASLFFDTDGKAYVMGTGNVWDNGTGVKERGIWIAEYDIERYCCLTEPVTIFNSALRGAASPEAPHIYHVGDWYYLVIAEGGTEHYHAVMVARSKTVMGFYQGNPANPVMTHRHMGFACPITNVGHADLVELEDGSWYAVLLGSRLIQGRYKNLGRETFLCPVVWEREWPLFSPQTGKVEWQYPAPESLEQEVYEAPPERDHFDEERLPLHLVQWGTPNREIFKIEDSNLKISCIPQTLDEELEPMGPAEKKREGSYAPFVARRQCAVHVAISTAMKFLPKGAETAGIGVVQAMNHQLHVERALEQGNQVVRAVLVTAEYNHPPYFPGFVSETHRRILKSVPWEKEEIVLKVEMNEETFTVSYGDSEQCLQSFCVVDGAQINPEKVGCMCGTLVGIYATGNHTKSENAAWFDWMRYQEL